MSTSAPKWGGFRSHIGMAGVDPNLSLVYGSLELVKALSRGYNYTIKV